MLDIQKIAQKFDLNSPLICSRQLFGGSVHKSYLVDLSDGSSIVLQNLNKKVIANPEMMMHNALAISKHISNHSDPNSVRFLRFINSVDGEALVRDEESGIWRGYRYIDRSHTPVPDESTENDSSEMAKALGLFTHQLSDFPTSELKFTFPDYHNTPKYFENFKSVVESSPKALIDTAKQEISYALKQQKYAPALLKMKLPARVVHNEARLRNLLVDNETGRAVCLIDYDTVMPGLMACDFGNAVRSSCRTCKCDERQMNRIRFDIDRYAEFTRLFIDIVRPILDKNEPASFAGGSIVMALEAGIRYLTDYLQGNTVYKVSYPEQNLYKARVQLTLCMQMQYYYKEMEKIVWRCL
ncbi:MAG: aminoglycoside phosphotransferase family protein [Oscillospiraceae bacterium]